MSKTLDDYFVDWEAFVFGYGYGTGEPYTIKALVDFFGCLTGGRSYDYKRVEAALGYSTAWLMINILCKADIFEYGCSPRNAWLTDKGERLYRFVATKSVEELVDLTAKDENYDHCYPDACNCGPDGYEKGKICKNPFWV